MLPDFIDVDGLRRSTRNSAGRLIHATAQGVVNFWRWFGNSKSVEYCWGEIDKGLRDRSTAERLCAQRAAAIPECTFRVVRSGIDPESPFVVQAARRDSARPIMAFHGTRSDFDAFRPSGRDLGMHFGTAEQASAKRFTGATARAGGLIVPVYLRSENPLRLMDTFRPGPGALLDISDQLCELGLMSPDEQNALFDALEGTSGSAAVGRSYRTLTACIRRGGFDGVVYQNMVEGVPRDYGESIPPDLLMESHNDSWIVFDPLQIKSALGNSGLFLKDDKSLTDQSGKFWLDLDVPARRSASFVMQFDAVSAERGVKNASLQ